MSMALYTLCLHPFLKYLENKLPGITIGRRSRSTAVMAYADDVTIFLTSINDIHVVEEALRLYERASGACINLRKSKALTVGGCNTQESIRGFEYYPCITILGITFCDTIEQTMKDTWARIIGRIRIQAKKEYDRDPIVAHRIQYVHKCLLSKLWYVTQLLPISQPQTQHVTTAVSWYTWKGAIFRRPVSTLQRSKRTGGMELIDIAAKCRALLLVGCIYKETKTELLPLIG
jgi:hypothetical protein